MNKAIRRMEQNLEYQKHLEKVLKKKEWWKGKEHFYIEQIKELQEEKREISRFTVQQFIRKYGYEELYTKIQEVNITLFEKIDASDYKGVIQFFLATGAIDESYGDLVAVFHGKDVKQGDKRYIRAVLDGVEIPYEKGLLGHSDADVLLHAIMDALLGAAALGDIGQHFPDTDPAYKGASSIELLKRVGELLEENCYYISNIDATVIAQRPKLAGYREQMRANIAEALHLELDQVNIKATTEEGLGFTGTGEGISSQAVCLIDKPEFYMDGTIGCGGCGGCKN